MFALTNFCFCYDLRRGCIVYAWLQMMIVIFLVTKFTWIHTIISHAFEYHPVGFLSYAIYFTFMISLEIIKGASCVALIWGIVKKNHMFYQPWLFIYGLENSLFVLISLTIFVVGFWEPFFFYLFPVFIIFSVIGWYFWSCVFVIYKKDTRPNAISFNSTYENFNLDNINVTV